MSTLIISNIINKNLYIRQTIDNNTKETQEFKYNFLNKIKKHLIEYYINYIILNLSGFISMSNE